MVEHFDNYLCCIKLFGGSACNDVINCHGLDRLPMAEKVTETDLVTQLHLELFAGRCKDAEAQKTGAQNQTQSRPLLPWQESQAKPLRSINNRVYWKPFATIRNGSGMEWQHFNWSFGFDAISKRFKYEYQKYWLRLTNTLRLGYLTLEISQNLK